MEITHDVWTAVAGLKYAGLRINKENLGVVEQSPILQELLEESKCPSENLFGWRLKAR